MKCRVCGGVLEKRVTSLPFKVDAILAGIDNSAELEIVRYAD